ncbi:hypothetical protein ScPMuIL_007492 [Solemya velum]
MKFSGNWKISPISILTGRASQTKALHYSESNRIPEIILEAKKGWVFIKNDSSPTGYLKGMHGYDPAKVPDMYPFFIASGPAFKRGVVVEPFDMVDIYPLMCHVLGLTPAPNNGSLRNVKSFLVKPPADEGSFEATAATSTLQFRDPIVVITISGWRKLVGQLWVYRETTVGIRGSRSQVTDNFLTGETTALPQGDNCQSQVTDNILTEETTAHHKSLNFLTGETTALSQVIDNFLTGETTALLQVISKFFTGEFSLSSMSACSLCFLIDPHYDLLGLTLPVLVHLPTYLLPAVWV